MSHSTGKRVQVTSSTLTELDLVKLRHRFPLPDGYAYRLPSESEVSFQQVVSGIPIYKASIVIGFRFPFSDLAAAFLHVYKLAPCQIHPFGWSQFIGFEVWCRLLDIVPNLNLLNAYLRLRDSHSSSSVPYTFQQVPCKDFNNRLFTRPPSKLRNFEREWLVVEVPGNVPFPMQWGTFRKPRLQTLKGLGRLYRDEIDRLAPGEPFNPLDLFEPENLLAAGWGTGIVNYSESESSQEGSTDEESSSENEIPVEAHTPEGFGSLIVVPDATLDANIGTLASDFANSSSGNFYLVSINHMQNIMCTDSVFVFLFRNECFKTCCG